MKEAEKVALLGAAMANVMNFKPLIANSKIREIVQGRQGFIEGYVRAVEVAHGDALSTSDTEAITAEAEEWARKAIRFTVPILMQVGDVVFCRRGGEVHWVDAANLRREGLAVMFNAEKGDKQAALGLSIMRSCMNAKEACVVAYLAEGPGMRELTEAEEEEAGLWPSRATTHRGSTA